MPRLIQTYLPDGTLEGPRIIEISESAVKGIVIPRLKLNTLNNRPEVKQPALYFLINSGDNQIYIGESENFISRLKNHDQSKDFWDVAVAIVSNTNTLEKSDIKYLESMAVEQAKATSASGILNRTIPSRNNIHEFKVHTLNTVLEDSGLILESLGYSVFTNKEDTDDVWYCKTKRTDAHAQFRGDKFVVLSGSIIDKSYAPSLQKDFPKTILERDELFEKFGKNNGDTIELIENISFKSTNHAGIFAAGRSVNAWTTWKNSDGKTMGEIIRKG